MGSTAAGANPYRNDSASTATIASTIGVRHARCSAVSSGVVTGTPFTAVTSSVASRSVRTSSCGVLSIPRPGTITSAGAAFAPQEAPSNSAADTPLSTPRPRTATAAASERSFRSTSTEART